MNSIELKPKFYAAVSGGKDSLFMLKYILSHIDKYPLDGVIHYELEIDFPFVSDVVSYMEFECNKIGIPFIRLKPSKSFYDLYHKYGLPSRLSRWCNSKYKLEPFNKFVSFKKSQGVRVYTYIGYCVDEYSRYLKREADEIYPLVDANIEESFILEWAKKVPLFNDYYLYNKRQGCMFCPMSKMEGLAYLKLYYPNEYKWFYDAIKFEETFGYCSDKPYSFFHKPIEEIDKTLMSYIDSIEHMQYFKQYE